MKDRSEGPRSLLRRLLSQVDREKTGDRPASGSFNFATTSTAAPPSEPIVIHPSSAPASTPLLTSPAQGSSISNTGYHEQPETSPIRPPAPVEGPAPEPLKPVDPRATQSTSVSTSNDQRLEAEATLMELRQKTAEVANEFAEGKINRAQFLSLYAHFNEKRIIIERMLMRDPNTQAWQSVARHGHTTFLKQHFEARALAFGVYDFGHFEPITTQGTTPLPMGAVQQILTALYIVMKARRDLKPLSRKINSGGWLVVVPARFTTAVALFSLEPAAHQVNLARDLHYDFERANRHALERGIRQPDQLVFPHRALFEQRSEF